MVVIHTWWINLVKEEQHREVERKDKRERVEGKR